jgi:lysophospholipase L1-like esterase
LANTAPHPHASADLAFMGDSITAWWWFPTANLGIPGQTTTQMLARFQTDVLGHGYKAVVILGGTNDIHYPKSPIEETVALATSNIETMASMAAKEKMDVILCDIPPIDDYDSEVNALNHSIDRLAAANNYKEIDYYSPMKGHSSLFRDDGVHPNDRGYEVMLGAFVRVLPVNY